MYLALLYELVDDYLERRGEFREEHLALARSASERGDLLLGGAFADPAGTALLVWRAERAAVEEFVQQDPYVRHGLVTKWHIRDWTVVVGAFLQ